MKRLVYSPRTEVFVKADSGIYDISPYVTEIKVNRKVNQVSNARVVFRNPGMQFTEHKSAEGSVGPVFHPMDPIIISMTRIRNRPIQVFTGYCDTTPYFQLFPGPCVIEASCTLKRLQYTYFDPGLPFVWDFLSQYGWSVTPTGIMATDADSSGVRQGNDTNKSNPITDQGFGGLLMAVLTNMGGWDPSNVKIEDLPQGIVELVTGLFEGFKSESEQADAEFQELIRRIIGKTTGIAGDGSGSGGSSGPLSGGDNPEKIFNYIRAKNLDCAAAGAVVGNAQQESGCNPASDGGGLLQWQGSRWSGLVSFANAAGTGVTDLHTQLDWMWHELQTGYRGALSALQGSGSVSEKTIAFEENYERAGIPNNENRVSYAQNAVSQYCK